MGCWKGLIWREGEREPVGIRLTATTAHSACALALQRLALQELELGELHPEPLVDPEVEQVPIAEDDYLTRRPTPKLPRPIDTLPGL